MGVRGGIEAGGTKIICAVGSGPDELSDPVRIETTTPAETLARIAAYFADLAKKPEAIGLASFGPIDLTPDSPTFGHILNTPKPGWSGFDFAGSLRRSLDVPVFVDTDVNAAVLAEVRWGAARGLRSALYLTIGTGIGGGALLDGALLHSLNHPEMGHIRIPRDLRDGNFPGVCPYHGDCLEGLASGVALSRRWSTPPEALPPDHAAWDIEARYLAQGIVNLTYTLAPERVILGGGVMRQAHLFPLIRRHVRDLTAGYLQNTAVQTDLDTYIVPPGLGDRSGILGAIALSQA